MSSVSRRHWIPQTPRILSHFWKLSISPFECESFVYSTHSTIEQSTLKQLRIVPEEHRSRGSSLVDQQHIKRHLHLIFTQNLKSLYIHISLSLIVQLTNVRFLSFIIHSWIPTTQVTDKNISFSTILLSFHPFPHTAVLNYHFNQVQDQIKGVHVPT